MPRVPRRCRWLIAAGPLALLLGLAPGAAPAQGSIDSWIKPPGATTWTPVLVAAAAG
jgi:hypothetical protein